MSDIPKTFDGKYYDRKYFADPEGKAFCRPDKSVEHWGYRSPDGEWAGARPIARAWKEVFEPHNLLDVGAGRGTFLTYARDAGIEAEGFDFSEWAVSDEGRYSRCKSEWLRLHDATEPWPYDNDSFDLVTALDFFEHIYSDDISFVISEMYRVASRYIFLQIATVDGVREVGYTLRKGDPIPIGLEGCAVAAHVTVQPETFWCERLNHEDWMLRRDMVNWFCSLVDPNVIANWLLSSIIVLEKF